ncbi:MAG: protein jag [Clostridiales bacterium]|nr:protein jag [Clostridiales bacterium]
MIISGKTVDSALAEASEKLGIPADKLTYEIVEQEKSGFLGIGSAPAKLKVIYSREGALVAKEFIDTLLRNMDIEAEVEMNVLKKSDREIKVNGEAAGVLIGHHGDTLDALQYLTNLAANKREEDESRDYVHITVDVENYRGKREQTLRALAQRMAQRVKKYKKSVMLEPMPPYERRIIHSEIQNIEGVSTNSIGSENNRRVVVYLESEGFSVPNRERGDKNSSNRNDGREKSASSSKRKEKERPARSQKRKEQPQKPVTPKYNDGDDLTAEELSDLISTYGSKERPQREQPTKFKSFDDYINSLVGSSDDNDSSDS